MKMGNYFSIPNLLTYLRILLVPFFVWSYLAVEKPTDYVVPAILLFISAISDFADGYIARHFGMITQWGKIIDPIADKLSQIAIALCLVVRYPWIWVLIAIFVVKELVFMFASLKVLKVGKTLDGALWFGKLSTAVFYIVMIILIAYPPMPAPIAYCLIAIAGAFLILSGVLYPVRLYELYQEYQREQAETDAGENGLTAGGEADAG